MSKYTTELRFICENATGLIESKGYASVNEIIDNARTKIFDFNYPIFDENYRAILEKKILKHYYTREIGGETVGVWKLWLDTKMNEIMPYYNKLYNSELLQFNPLYTINITKEGDKRSEGNQSENENINDTKNKTNKTTNASTDSTVETKQSTDTVSGTNKKTNTGLNTDKIDNTTENTTNIDTTNNETIKEDNSGSNTVTTNVTGSSDTTTNKTDKNTHYDLYSDTPQGALTYVDGVTHTESEGGVYEEVTIQYLTEARKVTDSGTSNATTNNSVENTTFVNGIESGKIERTDNTTNTVANESNGSNETLETHNINTTENRENSSTDTFSGTTNSTDSFESEINGTESETSGRIRSNTNELSSTEDYLEHVYGYEGKDASELLIKYRQTFLNIDMQIIEELEPLFFQLW